VPLKSTTSILAVLLSVASPSGAQDSARSVIERVDRILRGDSSHGVATMEVVTENWQREVTMEIWSLGTDYSLIRILAPAREAGTATLMADNDIWNYLPKVDRTIKVPASMMGGAWMGSHFTNDDLVKESQLIEDYDIETSFDGDLDGVAVWEFTLRPKPESAVIWGHIEFRVRQSDDMPLLARYYDEDGDLVRTLTYSEFRNLGNRVVPAVMTLVPQDKPGERTTVRYEELEFDVALDPSFFSLQNLRSLR
jgi:Outer membrane lipoprotein-sorting protein